MTSWSPAVANNTFAYSQEYTVQAKLTALKGFTLAGLASDHFTVEGATSVSFNASAGELTVTFPKTEDEVVGPGNFTKADVLKINGKSDIDWNPVKTWDPGSNFATTWTEISFDLKMNFDNGTSKDTTVYYDQPAWMMVTYQKRGKVVNASGTVFVESSSVENSPRPAEVVVQSVTSSIATDTVMFNFAKGEFFLKYSIDNSRVFETIRGQKVEIPFKGTVEMTRVTKNRMSTTNSYHFFSIVHVIEARHPAGGFVQRAPTHDTVVREFTP